MRNQSLIPYLRRICPPLIPALCVALVVIQKPVELHGLYFGQIFHLRGDAIGLTIRVKAYRIFIFVSDFENNVTCAADIFSDYKLTDSFTLFIHLKELVVGGEPDSIYPIRITPSTGR